MRDLFLGVSAFVMLAMGALAGYGAYDQSQTNELVREKTQLEIDALKRHAA